MHGASRPLEPHFFPCLMIFHLQHLSAPNVLPLSIVIEVSFHLAQPFPPHCGHFLLQHTAFPERIPNMPLNFSQASSIRFRSLWTRMKYL